MIASNLNMAGIPARRGGKWQKTSVSRLINIGIEQAAVSNHLQQLHDLAAFYATNGDPAAVDARRLAKEAQDARDAGVREAMALQGELYAIVGWSTRGERPEREIPTRAYETEVKRYLKELRSEGGFWWIGASERMEDHIAEWKRGAAQEEKASAGS